MKKNKMMRLASALLVAVMLTTCTISGTYAKYVTTDSTSATARVAKWGVKVTADAEGAGLFAKTYETGNETVISAHADEVVAPGTKNTEGISFTITGAPEVTTSIKFEMTNCQDVYLTEGKTLSNDTTGDETDYYEVDAPGYYPVKFTLTRNGAGVLSNATLAQVEAYFDAINGTGSHVVAPNQNLADAYGQYKLTWAWEFNGEDDYCNQCDTTLGNLAVNKAAPVGVTSTSPLTFGALTEVTDFSTNIKFDVTITVSQVD